MANLTDMFTEFTKATDEKGQIMVLRKNQSALLLYVLDMVFNPDITFGIQSIPSFTKADTPAITLDDAIGNLHLFLKNPPGGVEVYTDEQKSEELSKILAKLTDADATTFSNIILKNLNVANLNREIVEKAFPRLTYTK
jgi:hypothetical protein